MVLLLYYFSYYAWYLSVYWHCFAGYKMCGGVFSCLNRTFFFSFFEPTYPYTTHNILANFFSIETTSRTPADTENDKHVCICSYFMCWTFFFFTVIANNVPLSNAEKWGHRLRSSEADKNSLISLFVWFGCGISSWYSRWVNCDFSLTAKWQSICFNHNNISNEGKFVSNYIG